jgi:zinc transporter
VREQTDRMTRYVEDLDLARERALVLYILSLVTVIVLLLSFLTGIFGMNVGGVCLVWTTRLLNS